MSEKYIVKNCPSCIISPSCCAKYHIDNRSSKDCQNIEDCVIKQVIEKCKERSGKCERCKASEDYQPTDCLDYCSNDDVIFADDILQLFDIEETRK